MFAVTFDISSTVHAADCCMNYVACIPVDLISEAGRGILTIGQPRFSIILAQVCVATLNTAHTIVSRDVCIHAYILIVQQRYLVVSHVFGVCRSSCVPRRRTCVMDGQCVCMDVECLKARLIDCVFHEQKQ